MRHKENSVEPLIQRPSINLKKRGNSPKNSNPSSWNLDELNAETLLAIIENMASRLAYERVCIKHCRRCQ